MELSEIISEAKGQKKLQPWEMTLQQFIRTNRPQSVTYQGWAGPKFMAPSGVTVMTGSEKERLYGKERVDAKERVYQRDMGSGSFEGWAVKLNSARGTRFRILLLTYTFKEGQKFDPQNLTPKNVVWAVRAGFVFDGVKQPFAGYLPDQGVASWGGDDFADFVRKHGKWNPPKKPEETVSTGRNITLMKKHRKAVADALRQGQRVSDIVLKDYPRLKGSKPGTPGFYVAQHLYLPDDTFAKAGQNVKRVVYGSVGNKITPMKLRVLGLPEDPDIRGLPVTHDVGFWKDQLEKDMQRPSKDAQVIFIKVAPGDVFIADPQTSKKTKASSAILLTKREELVRGKDFHVEGKLAGKS